LDRLVDLLNKNEETERYSKLNKVLFEVIEGKTKKIIKKNKKMIK
jgi:hypothetical protein